MSSKRKLINASSFDSTRRVESKSRLAIWLIVLAALLLLAQWSLPQTDGLTVHVLDVGQGDSILIRTPTNQKILIDSGRDARVLSVLRAELSYFERRLDLVVLTHPDADHLGGFGDILGQFTVGGVLLTGVQHDTRIYADIWSQLAERGVPVYLASSETDLDLGAGVLLDVVWPVRQLAGSRADNLNATSIVIRLLYGDTSVLLTGDAEITAEAALLRSPVDLTSSILKVGHHGSQSSSSADFLAAVQSEVALISAGVDNRYGHPHAEVLERIANQQVYSTFLDGTLSFVSDGQHWSRLDK